MRTAVLILSSPRSGSSCLTACVQLCGLDLGKDIATVKDQFNQKGYFENTRILRFNVSVLQTIASDIHHPAELTDNQTKHSLTFEKELRSIIETQYSDETILIKDARISILHDLYAKALSEYAIKVIWLTRDENAVAKSLRRMNLIGEPRGLEIYQAYQVLIEKFIDSYKLPFVKVSFEELLRSPIEPITKICNLLNIDVSTINTSAIKDFVDNTLVNFKSTKKEKALMVSIQDGTPYLKTWYNYYIRYFLPDDIYFVCCNTPKGTLDNYKGNQIHKKISVHDICQKTPILNEIKKQLFTQYNCVVYADLDEILHHSQGLDVFIRNLSVEFVKCTSYQIVHKRAEEGALNLDRPIKDQRAFWSRTPWFDKSLILKKDLIWGPGLHHVHSLTDQSNLSEAIIPSNDLLLIHLRIADYAIAHALNCKNAASKDKPIGGGEYNFFTGGQFEDWWSHGIQNKNPVDPIPSDIRNSFMF